MYYSNKVLYSISLYWIAVLKYANISSELYSEPNEKKLTYINIVAIIESFQDDCNDDLQITPFLGEVILKSEDTKLINFINELRECIESYKIKNFTELFNKYIIHLDSVSDGFWINRSPEILSTLISKLNFIENGKVLDFACGNGGFLYSYLKSHPKMNCYGFDKSEYDIQLCKLRFKVNDLSVSINSSHTNDKFDAIICNPPFGKTQDLYHWDVFSGYYESNEFKKYGISKDNDMMSLLFSLSLLKDKNTSRAALIMPDGVLFKIGKTAKIRKILIDNKHIETIVSLPIGLINHSKININLIILNKQRNESDILMIDARNKEVNEKLFKKITNCINKREGIDGFSTLLNSNDIFDYDLSVYRYIRSKNKLNGIRQLKEIKNERNELINRVDKLINEFNEIMENKL